MDLKIWTLQRGNLLILTNFKNGHFQVFVVLLRAIKRHPVFSSLKFIQYIDRTLKLNWLKHGLLAALQRPDTVGLHASQRLQIFEMRSDTRTQRLLQIQQVMTADRTFFLNQDDIPLNAKAASAGNPPGNVQHLKKTRAEIGFLRIDA